MRTTPPIRGFTLIELVLVLAIIAIAAMVAVPSMRTFTRGRLLPATATDLLTVARWCSIKAKADGLAYRLNFDIDETKYWVTCDDGTTGLVFETVIYDDRLETPLPEGVTFEEITVPANDEGEVFVTFEPNGRTDPASITLVSSTARLVVACETPMGSYRIFDPLKDEEPLLAGVAR